MNLNMLEKDTLIEVHCKYDRGLWYPPVIAMVREFDLIWVISHWKKAEISKPCQHNQNLWKKENDNVRY